MRAFIENFQAEQRCRCSSPAPAPAPKPACRDVTYTFVPADPVGTPTTPITLAFAKVCGTVTVCIPQIDALPISATGSAILYSTDADMSKLIPPTPRVFVVAAAGIPDAIFTPALVVFTDSILLIATNAATAPSGITLTLLSTCVSWNLCDPPDPPGGAVSPKIQALIEWGKTHAGVA
jgi:hypothetical protein